jgi:hypothetical protein
LRSKNRLIYFEPQVLPGTDQGSEGASQRKVEAKAEPLEGGRIDIYHIIHVETEAGKATRGLGRRLAVSDVQQGIAHEQKAVAV